MVGLAVSGGWLETARAQDAPFVLGAREPDPSVEIDTSLWGRSYSIQYPQLQIGGTQEGLDLDMTRFLAPLRNDGSPYSLRPYLQRISSLSLSAGINHFATHNPFGAPDRTDTGSGVGGSLNIYVKRWLALTANLGYGYDVLHDVDLSQSTHSVSGGVGAGFRAGDWRADISYSADTYHPSGSSWASPRRFASLSLFGVIARRMRVSVSGNTIPGGGAGGLGVEYFPSPELGVFGSGSASTGRLYQNPSALTSTRYVGTVGIAGWVDASSGIVGSYTRTSEHVPMQVIDTLDYNDDQTSNELSLQIYVRFP